MDKEKLIDKIKNLQGLTNDEKAVLLGLLRSFKKYGLVWEEKLEEVEERLREEIPVLTEVKERAIISDSANAQYPLIMKQQTITDAVIKDLFGVSGRELQEIRTEIAGLQKGELIIKDQMAFALDIGKKYKKIKVSHLI